MAGVNQLNPITPAEHRCREKKNGHRVFSPPGEMFCLVEVFFEWIFGKPSNKKNESPMISGTWWNFEEIGAISFFSQKAKKCSTEVAVKVVKLMVVHQGVFKAHLVFVPAACGVSAVSRQTRGLFWEAFDGTRMGVFWGFCGEWVRFLADCNSIQPLDVGSWLKV